MSFLASKIHLTSHAQLTQVNGRLIELRDNPEAYSQR